MLFVGKEWFPGKKEIEQKFAQLAHLNLSQNRKKNIKAHRLLNLYAFDYRLGSGVKLYAAIEPPSSSSKANRHK